MICEGNGVQNEEVSDVGSGNQAYNCDSEIVAFQCTVPRMMSTSWQHSVLGCHGSMHECPGIKNRQSLKFETKRVLDFPGNKKSLCPAYSESR